MREALRAHTQRAAPSGRLKARSALAPASTISPRRRARLSAFAGLLGAVLAMAIVSIDALLLGSAWFQQTYRVDTPTVLGVVLAAGAVSLAVTALSAHRATHVCPLLDVLRDE